MAVNKKMNEMYLSKQVTLILPYRGKTREINYLVVGVFGTQFQMTAKLKSKKFPCEIPHLENIEMRLNNEFPTKLLIKKINHAKQKETTTNSR